jgi:AraC-like DNA-binding protein
MRSDPSQGAFSDQVRMMTLSLCSPELPGLDQVVAQFAMSHRTFQRKISSEGTLFRAIVNEIKHQVSFQLERENSFQTQEIAYTLRYSEPSAYLHGLRKWKIFSAMIRRVFTIPTNNSYSLANSIPVFLAVEQKKSIAWFMRPPVQEEVAF